MTASPFPFAAPPPPVRSMLQPSLHGRGVRPYLYTGAVDEWHAPGARWTNNGDTTCAVDAAWLVESVLGPPRQHPKLWPGVPGAADRARALGHQKGLTPLQQTGAAFLAERDYAALLDPPGAGKSPQSLIAAEARLSMGITPENMPAVLIVCPALAKRHWQREVKKWTGHDAAVLETMRGGAIPQARYVICNYDILPGARKSNALGVMETNEQLPGWGATLKGQFVIVIADESHNIRTRSSKRYKALRDVCTGIVTVWLLSATPMPNYVRDLWAQLDLMSNGLYGDYWSWAKKYCGAVRAKYGWVDTGADCLDELRGRIGFFMLGRTKAEVETDWPEKRRESYLLDVDITAPTLTAQDDLPVQRSNAVARALRATARAKRGAAITQAVEAVRAGQKVVVFTYLREQAEAISKGIAHELKQPVQCVNGDMSPEQRDTQAREFRETLHACAFVATIDSIGVSLSLVGAELVIFADLVWEPWKLVQAEGRVHRFDSKKRVLIRYLLAAGTIDEALENSVITKLATIEKALGQDADSAALSGTLGGVAVDTTSVVDDLFACLKAWGEQKEAA